MAGPSIDHYEFDDYGTDDGNNTGTSRTAAVIAAALYATRDGLKKRKPLPKLDFERYKHYPGNDQIDGGPRV